MKPELPEWPFFMGSDLAAAFLGLSRSKFLSMIPTEEHPERPGPQSVLLPDCSDRRWARPTLEAWGSRIVAEQITSVEEAVTEAVRLSPARRASRRGRGACNGAASEASSAG